MQDQSAPEAWQYRIGQDPTEGSIAVGDLHLSVGPGLDLCRLQTPEGDAAGILLGFPIDLETQRMARGALSLAQGPGTDPEGFAAHVLTRFAGRFIWIWEAPSGLRLYLDSTGQVPCVYDAEARRAGTSAASILDEAAYDARFDRGLFDALHVAQAGWGVGGLTMHRGVTRLMPNHYLDLLRWQPVRHWPGPEGLPVAADPEAAVAEFIDLIRTQYRAMMSEDRKLAISLTAGRDTRMLLACARPFLEEVEFVTVTGGDVYSRDTVVAHHIASQEGLTHFDLPRIKATPEAREAYLRRGGQVVADTNADTFPSVHPIAKSHYMAGGGGGEIARGFAWAGGEGAPKGKPSAEMVLTRFSLTTPPAAVEAMAAWIDALPVDRVNEVMDLAYIEQRMGHWSGAQFPSDPGLVRMQSGHQGRPGRAAAAGVVELGKTHAAMSEAIEIWRVNFVRPKCAQVGITKIVSNNQQNVGHSCLRWHTGVGGF